MNIPFPRGFRIALDPTTRQLDRRTVRGGSPARIVRFSVAGQAAWNELRSGPVVSTAGAILARHLTDRGLAHPRPPTSDTPLSVTIIIPVRDRLPQVARCLAALDRAYPIVVVDDGSQDADGVARLAEMYSATLVRRSCCGGPAAARNSGLIFADTDLIAFLDSDCVAEPGWIQRLADHLADPLVAAVAPRILALPSITTAGRYAAAAGSLDMGPRESRVAPGTRVSYVPTAALLVRREALQRIGAFDEQLRYGEDVDLVWRLHDAGLRIRYEPAVCLRHEEPQTWWALLSRRFHYGTSAAPLALRHPTAITPLVVATWPTATSVAALAGRPVAAVVGLIGTFLTTKSTLRQAQLPTDEGPTIVAEACWRTLVGIARYTNQFAAPLLLIALVRPPGATTARRRRNTARAVALILVAPMTAFVRDRPQLDIIRFTAARLADDIAYGMGVWAGSLRHRTVIPLRPTLIRPSGRPRGTDATH
ncbi:mycofactocin biosynthesis glycosyltransferase MftF [Nocardia sp. NPDC059239]|uniref:mycofactocin biosynthesis glycosyltransferase MftF n=1 Tax=unclassified Nocardia TaxID=2637762 RepID=UPI0036ABAB14